VVSTKVDIWVADTCSIVEVRRVFPKDADQVRVYKRLQAMVVASEYCFPKQVVGELEALRSTRGPDRPLEFVKNNESNACVHPIPYSLVVDILKEVPGVLDHKKVATHDEADPYVLALAILLAEQGHQVTLLTDERKDNPSKMSMNTACGILRLPCMPTRTFLQRSGILPSP
jgi:hypothetical protein